MTPAIIAALAHAEERLKDAKVAHARLGMEMQLRAAEWNAQLTEALAVLQRCEGEVTALTALLKHETPGVPLSDDALHGRA